MQAIVQSANSIGAVNNAASNASFNIKPVNPEYPQYTTDNTYVQPFPHRVFTTPLLPNQPASELSSLNTNYLNFGNLALNTVTPGLSCISYFPQPSPGIPPYFTPSIQSSSPTPSLVSDGLSPNSLASELHHREAVSDEEYMPLIVRNYSNEFTLGGPDPTISLPNSRAAEFTSWLESTPEPESFPECKNFEKYARELFDAETKLGATEESLLITLRSYHDHYAAYESDITSIQSKFDRLILQVVSIYLHKSITSKTAPHLKPFELMVRTLGEKFCKLREATLQHHLSSAEISFSHADNLDVPRMEIEPRLASDSDINQGSISFDDPFNFPYIQSMPMATTTGTFTEQTIRSSHPSETGTVQEDNQDSTHTDNSSIPNELSKVSDLHVTPSPSRTPSPPPRKKKRASGTTDPNTPTSAPNYTTRRVYFSKASTLVLKRWLDEHHEDPYPDAKQKQEMAALTGLTYDQVQHWFINARMRIWRPMLRKQKEAAERQLQSSNLSCTKGIDALSMTPSTTEFQHVLISKPTVPISIPPASLASPDADLTPQQWHKKIRDEHLKVDVNDIQGLNSKPKAPRKSLSLVAARPRVTRPRKSRG